MGKPEQDFLRFRRKGDSRALARVFDRLAPELLLLGLHVTGDQSRAEDLIQETFLRAMEAAERFRPGSALRPWLVGILTNAAREARRIQARPLVPDGVDVPGDDDPVDSAQNHELAERLAQVVESLPSTYHQVLILRLSKGMSAVEIAHALGRPPKTVQTQMRRGLDLLRRALPTSFGVPLALSVVPGRGMAAVRSLLLERAGTSVGTVAGIGLLGGLLLLAKAALPFALVAGFGYVAVEGLPLRTGGVEEAPPEDVVPPPQSPVAEMEAPAPASPDPALLVRSDLSPSTITGLRGRIVAADTGEPLAGAVASLRGWGRNGEATARYGQPPSIQEEATGRTDGTFQLEVEPHPAQGFRLTARAEGRAAVLRDLGALVPGEMVELGDIALPPGAFLEGRFTDGQGRPVGGLRVALRQPSLRVFGTTGSYPKEFVYTTRSAPDGTFVGEEPLAAGEWSLGVSSREYELVEPESVLVGAGDGTVQVHVVVGSIPEAPTITGVVVDGQGTPVSGVDLVASVELFAVPNRSRGISGTGGVFTIRRDGDDDRPVRIELNPTSTGPFVLVSSEAEHEWGAEDVRVVVQRPATVNLEVVEAGTRVPVEDFSVRCLPPEDMYHSGFADMRTRGRHEGGKVTLDDVRLGRNRVIVYPEDRDLVPSEPVEIDVGSNGAGLCVELQRRQPLTVQVLRGDGSPVVGSEVELLRKEGGRGELQLQTISGDPYRAYSGFYGTVMAIVLDAGVTGEDGKVVLRGPWSRGGLAVKAKGPGHPAQLETGVSLEQDQPVLVLRVLEEAVVHGALVPAASLPELTPKTLSREAIGGLTPAGLSRYWPSVSLREQGGFRRFPPAPWDEIPVDREGRFRIDGVPPGTWDLYLRAFVEGGPRVERLVATVSRLEAGETREVEVDFSPLIPGRLSGQVFVNGEVHGEESLILQWSEPGQMGWRTHTEIRTDGEGRFSAVVTPAELRLVLLPEEGALGASIASTETVHAPAGEAVQQVFNLVRGRMRLRLLEADGSPATGRLFQFDGILAPVGSSWGVETDEEGWLVLDPAPRDAVTLTTWPPGLDDGAISRLTPQERQARRILLGPVQVPPGQTDAEFVLRLQEKE